MRTRPLLSSRGSRVAACYISKIYIIVMLHCAAPSLLTAYLIMARKMPFTARASPPHVEVPARLRATLSALV